MKRNNGDLDHLRLDLTAVRPIGVEERGGEGAGDQDCRPAGVGSSKLVTVAGGSARASGYRLVVRYHPY
jgi:hypothetical protein